jgi:aminopeptidase N
MNRWLLFILFSTLIINLQAQTFLKKSDIEAREQFYKSEMQRHQQLYRYIQRPKSTSMQSYDAIYYKLEFEIGLDPNFFYGRATEKFVSLVNDLNSIDLDFDSFLKVLNVEGDADSSKSNDYILSLVLNKTFNSGDTIEVIIEYEGIPRTSGLYAGFWFNKHGTYFQGTYSPAIYTLSEPYGARSWWPCKDDPTDKPDAMDILITIPDNTYNNQKLYAVSNGTLVSLIENDNGTRSFHWHEQYPIATYLVSLAISNYEIYSDWYVTTENDSMPVIYYVYPEKISTALENYGSTVDMIKTYSDRFIQYPFFEEKYGMANFGWGGAMEHQTVSSMGTMNFWVVAHELAHQWFGNLVTCADFHHIWLNEGWATYLEAIYAEKLYGQGGYHSYMNDIAYYNLGKTIYVEDPFTENVFDIIVYDKGAWVLHMLRHVMGNTLFFEATKSYLNDLQVTYQSATTADFQQIMEQYYGESLNWFFQEWIYGKGFPIYQYSWTYQEEGDQYILDLTIEQIQKNYGAEEVFTMPLDIMIMTIPGPKKDTVKVFNDQRIQSYQFITDLQPASVILDPDDWVLQKSERVAAIDPGEEPLPLTYKLEQNYPNPFNATTSIKFIIPETEKVTLDIYNVQGELVEQLLKATMSAGEHNIVWDASNVSSGVYYYQIKAGSFLSVKKCLLIK